MGHRNYSEQFKRETVRLVTEEGYNPNRAGDSVGVHPSTVRAWVQRYAPQTPRQGAYASEADELSVLRQENTQLRMERDILKKAAAFFASQSA